MPILILPQDQDGQEIFNAISSFSTHLESLNCFANVMHRKKKMFQCWISSNTSCVMSFPVAACPCSRKTGSFREAFSKNTFYRFLNDPNNNWLRFTTLLSRKVADTVEPLTDADRVNAFVVDDSLFERTSCKKTELASRVFDHVSMKYRKGYRLMTLGWTDGNTFFPVNSSLLAS